MYTQVKKKKSNRSVISITFRGKFIKIDMSTTMAFINTRELNSDANFWGIYNLFVNVWTQR